MRELLLFSLVGASAAIAGCATSDTEQFHRANASGGCEVGTGGPGQPPCKMVYWSSRDGMVDPHEQAPKPSPKPKDD